MTKVDEKQQEKTLTAPETDNKEVTTAAAPAKKTVRRRRSSKKTVATAAKDKVNKAAAPSVSPAAKTPASDGIAAILKAAEDDQMQPQVWSSGAVAAADDEQLTADKVPLAGGVSAGQLLKQMRTEHGLSVDELAGLLKIKAGALTAIENDQFDKLPSILFVRSVASSIARYFRADLKPVLAKLPPLENGKSAVEKLIQEKPETKPVPFTAIALRDRRKYNYTWLLAALAVLVVLLMIYFFWVRSAAQQPAPQPAATAESNADEAPSQPGVTDSITVIDIANPNAGSSNQ